MKDGIGRDRAHLRTLFVSSDFKPDRGGIAELYANLLSRFPPGSVDVLTIDAQRHAGGDDSPVAERAFPHSVTRLPMTHREASRLQNVVRWLFHARGMARRQAYDAVQIGTLRPAGAIGAWLQRLEGLPFLVYVHGNDVLKERRKVGGSRAYRATSRDILRRAGALVANSRFTAGLVADLASAAGAPEAGARIRVVHPGADPRRFYPGPEGVGALRARLGLGGGRVALSVARLEPRKGVDRVLEAVAALWDDFPDLVYVVVGEGTERAGLERRAVELGLGARVRFTGEVPAAELPVFYRMAEVFLMPSRRGAGDDVEGFGIALSEASATGLPVVGGKAGGVPEAVVAGETGILVDPEDAGAIAGALRRLLSDRELATRMARAGREAVLRYFNWDRAAAEAWSVVNEVAQARRRTDLPPPG